MQSTKTSYLCLMIPRRMIHSGSQKIVIYPGRSVMLSYTQRLHPKKGRHLRSILPVVLPSKAVPATKCRGIQYTQSPRFAIVSKRVDACAKPCWMHGPTNHTST